jgi:hypothetical protein
MGEVPEAAQRQQQGRIGAPRHGNAGRRREAQLLIDRDENEHQPGTQAIKGFGDVFQPDGIKATEFAGIATPKILGKLAGQFVAVKNPDESVPGERQQQQRRIAQKIGAGPTPMGRNQRVGQHYPQHHENHRSLGHEREGRAAPQRQSAACTRQFEIAPQHQQGPERHQ